MTSEELLSEGPVEGVVRVGAMLYDWDRLSAWERAEVKKMIEENPGIKVVVLRRTEVKVSQKIGEERDRLVPPDLEETYSLLWMRALRAPRGISSGEAIEKARGLPVLRTSTGQTETRGGAKGSRKSGGSADFILDEAAFVFKAKIDRKLRKITREIKVWLQARDSRMHDGREVDIRRCSVCKRYGEEGWLYCPVDGKPMESTRRN